MTTPRSDDPTVQLWHRVRRPLQILVLVFLVASFRRYLFSGEIVATATALMVLGFFGWLFFLAGFPEGDKQSAAYWRSATRTNARWWLFWSLLALSWMIWVSVLYGFNPARLVIVAIPALGLCASVWVFKKADRLAEAHAEKENPSPDMPPTGKHTCR